MTAYVDSSVLLRVVLGQPDRLSSWTAITKPVSSVLIRLECLRTIDRARLRLALADDQVAAHRSAILEQLEAFDLAHLDGSVLDRAADPFPTALGSLDALHLATALALREGSPDLPLATHDSELARAARSIGFRLLD